MKQSNYKLSLLITSIVFLALVIVGYTVVTARKSFKAGEAQSGLQATVASTSAQVVGTTQRLLVATSTCAARIISTRTQPMMLSFGDNQGFVPTATTGILQAASTTVAYDSGLFGCGAMRVISGTVTSDTIVVTETY